MPDTRTSPPIVNVYIDGYNFYRPIQQEAEKARDQHILHLAWCNYCTLASRLADLEFGSHRIGAIKLFTAYARDDVRRIMNSDGLQRKEVWLEALHLGTHGQVHISFGRWELKPHDPDRTKEKLTDVKLAISLVRDGLLAAARSSKSLPAHYDPAHLYEDDDPAAPFDKAIVISCDKDFLPAAEMVQKDTRKTVSICFPYLSTPYHLPPGSPIKTRVISEGDLRASSLPDEIVRPDGTKITWTGYVLSKGWPLKRTAKP
jgi:hypothetical protein